MAGLLIVGLSRFSRLSIIFILKRIKKHTKKFKSFNISLGNIK